MFSKFVQSFGILLIILFSAVSIFFSMAVREYDEGSTIKRWFSYTSIFEDRFYDMRMIKTIDKTKSAKELVMLDIDDESLKEIGQWPVARETWTKAIDQLKHFGAKVVAFDVFFAENSKVCSGVSPDVGMANAIERFQSVPGNKVILPYSLDTQGSEHFKELPDDLYNYILDAKQKEGVELKISHVSKAVYPIQTLREKEAALGHIQVTADADGIMRQYRIVGNIDSLYLPSYGLSAYQHFTGDNTSLEMFLEGESKLITKNGAFNINFLGETKLRWYGDIQNFPKVPLWKLIQAKPDDKKMHDILKNTIVFVGASAYGAYDLRHTPINAMLPGIYFHMNMTKMLLDGNHFKPSSESTVYSWLLLIIGTCLMLVIQYFGHAILDLFSMITMVLAAYFVDTYYLLPLGYDIKLFFCLFSIVSCYSWNTFVNFYLANKDKAFLKNAFGSYISPELIDEMYSTGEPPKLGGDSGIITAYFTDIQGFSTFSEKLSATELVELLNEYLTAMTDILLEDRGTLDKYEGDAIIAFFGAPMPLPDHATRSCKVALAMQKSLVELTVKWKSEGDKWPEIVHAMKMRIGINTGEIVTGNMGSRDRMNYTMMGDSVNLAARLEEAAKQYGIFTQLSQYTKDEIEDGIFHFRELDTIKVMGKTEPVTTFDLIGLVGDTEDFLVELCEKFDKGIALYKAQQWDDAISIFNETLAFEHKRFPDLMEKSNPSKIYIERCEQFKDVPPPPNWDGVFTLTSK